MNESSPHLPENDSAQPGDRHGDAKNRQSDGAPQDGEPSAEAGYDAGEEKRLRVRGEKGRNTWHYWQRQSIGTIGGPATFGEGSPAVGRDFVQINYAQRVGARGWLVSEGHLKRLAKEFVEVPIRTDGPSRTSLQRLVQVLQGSDVALITGPSGSGREALAVRGLNEIVGDQKIVVFDGSVTPADLTLKDVESAAGYVLSAEVSGQSPREQTRRLQGLSRPGSKIVVIAEDDDPAGQFDEVVVPHRCPDQVQVFKRLVRTRFGFDPDERDDLAAPLAAVHGSRMAEIERVAELCYSAIQDGRSPGDYLERETYRQVRLMLTEPLPPSMTGTRSPAEILLLPLFRQAIMLSAAVFHDAPLHVVGDAAQELHARLRGRIRAAAPPVPPFADNTEELLGWLRCELVTQEATGFSGSTPAGTVLRFHNPGMPEAILARLWMERHIAVPLLIGQLDDWALGRSDAASLTAKERRQSAAMALGRLASLDLEHALERIEKWIKEGTQNAVQAVGWAVQVILADNDLSEEMWKRVGRWEKRSPAFRYAALSVHAECMTEAQVGPALEVVSRETVRDRGIQPWMALLIASVIRRAVGLGMLGPAFDVIGGWLERVDQLSHPLRGSGRVTWVRVQSAECSIHELIGLTLRYVGDADDGARQNMLRAVGEDDRVRATHTRMWQLALTWPSTSQKALDQMGRWIGAADQDVGLEASVRALLVELVRVPSCARRLDFSARRWLREWAGSRPASVRVVNEEIFGRGVRQS